jgi:hypothetical protein
MTAPWFRMKSQTKNVRETEQERLQSPKSLLRGKPGMD